MRMRRPMRWNTASPSSSSSSRTWRLIADCDTRSFSPAAVNDPVSAMARMISSCRRSMRACYMRCAHGYKETHEQSGFPFAAPRPLSNRGARSRDGFRQIPGVHLDAHEAKAKLGARDSGRSKAQERIGDGLDPVEAVKPQAHLGKLRRKGRRVWPLL